MKSIQKKKSRPGFQNLNADYNSAGRDNQRTEKEVENFSQPGIEEIKKRKGRTERANSKPNRNKIN